MIITIIGIIYIGIGILLSAFAAFMLMSTTKDMTDEEFVEYIYEDDYTRSLVLDNWKPSTVRTTLELISPLCNIIAWPALIYRFVKWIKEN